MSGDVWLLCEGYPPGDESPGYRTAPHEWGFGAGGRKHRGIGAMVCLMLAVWLVAACQPAVLAPAPEPTKTQAMLPATTQALLPSPTRLILPTRPPVTATPASERVLLHGTLIDGTSGPPIQDAILIIRDGRIAAVGKAGSLEAPDGAEIIDVQGLTILPGFINAHVHSGYNRENLRAWLWEGVTTVRDLATTPSARFDLRDEVNRDAQYARLVAVGPMITVKGGYPIEPWGLPSITVSTPEEARQAVNDLLERGADLIKIPLESGLIFGEIFPTLSDEQVSAIVDAAHQRGVPVAVHVTAADDLRRAARLGLDDIAHMVTDRLPDDLAQQLAEQGTYWEPTIELWKLVGRDQDRLVLENLGKFVRAGGHVALGTDYDGYSATFQLGMPINELQWMQQAGMSPMQVIQAATRNAAHVCNLDEDLGTLEPGKIADILIVSGDPLEDLQNLSNVVYVIHNGVVIRSPGP